MPMFLHTSSTTETPRRPRISSLILNNVTQFMSNDDTMLPSEDLSVGQVSKILS